MASINLSLRGMERSIVQPSTPLPRVTRAIPPSVSSPVQSREHESLRWSQSGNEIVSQMTTHVGVPPCRDQWALNVLARISLGAIKGFCTPFLNYTNETFHLLAAADFIDHCRHSCHHRGHRRLLTTRWAMGLLWSKESVEGNHRSPLDTANGAPAVNNTATLEYMVNTFAARYDGNRQPGSYARLSISPSIVNMINQYLNWLPEQQDVWIVSDEELPVGVQNPSQSLKWISLISSSSRLLTLIR
ncbi:hypothetical protein HD554DRAFT_2037888 [Boletus coccyginus]|nr:hypothetical protein HD554DRAFT_2037888 [Boletus coccyginus]